MPGYTWVPIEDLPLDWEEFVSDELKSLAEIWKNQKNKLQGSEALNRFNAELRRQWAIETGIIEGLYTIDRGITRLLIERGIQASLIPHGKTNKPVEAILPIIKDQESAMEGLFDFVRQNRPLSTSYIKELHQALTAHQVTVEAVDQFGRRMPVEFKRGVWKDQPNNPTTSNGTLHQYCPVEQVASEMDRLVEMHTVHQLTGIPPEVEAAWLHHRFTQIHPFQDGNGRVARALASLVFLRAEWFPLVVISDEHRDVYIEALERADHGDLSSLIELFTRLQQRAFVRALSISEEVISNQESLNAAIRSVVSRLRSRAEEERTERRRVFDISKEIENKTATCLQNVADEIRSKIVGIDNSYQIEVDRGEGGRQHWFWNQVVNVAKTFSYFADLNTYHAWIRLKIRKVRERQTEIVFSFHSLGTEFVGIISTTAFIEHRIWGEDGSPTIDGPDPVCRETFQFFYNQEAPKVLARFEKWLNDAIVVGLDQWRRQL